MPYPGADTAAGANSDSSSDGGLPSGVPHHNLTMRSRMNKGGFYRRARKMGRVGHGGKGGGAGAAGYWDEERGGAGTWGNDDGFEDGGRGKGRRGAAKG